MATLRERKPGVWEIRVFTGRDTAGRPTQISRTMRGTKREAQHVATTLEFAAAVERCGSHHHRRADRMARGQPAGLGRVDAT